MKQRLQKILAQAGQGSRRECEGYIAAGRVTVNREVVTQLGSQADPATDDIRLDGEPVRPPKPRYYLVNKPRGYLCTNQDEYGRRRAIDLVPEPRDALHTVGRLDAGSEGLIIITNDGELTNRLTHPRYGVAKTYRVEVSGPVTQEELELLRKGMWSSIGRLDAERVKIVGHPRQRTALEFVLAEGRNRAIRRMLARLGHKVKLLRRIRIGPVSDDRLELGTYRVLRDEEIDALRQASQAPTPTPKRRRPGAGKRRD